MSSLRHVRLDRDDEIALVTVDRPAKLNALNPEVLREIGEVFASLREADDILGVLVTGAGDRAFVAGADIGVLAEMDPVSAVGVSRQGQDVFDAIERFPRPVVAAVGGYALGGGLELALACHVRVASENARFGLPEVSLGVIPGYGGTVRLARLVGLGRAVEMTLTGEPVDAQQALEWGLVTAVVARDELLDVARATLRRITKNGPLAVRLALKSIYGALGASPEAAVALESSLFGVLAGTSDFKEGMAAFLEKRKPSFEGR